MITALMSDTIERVRQNYVFDAGLMAWVPMTQPGGGTGGTASNFGAGFPVQGTAVGFIEEGTGLMAGAVVTAAGALKVDAAFSGGTVDQGLGGASPWLIEFDGAQPISAAALPLPTGAATEATLAALNAKVTAVNTGAVVVSSSALPTGAATFAEQQTQSASLSVLDDWDESDRAKVNPIAGQAGVQGGSGAVSATTQRVTLATDVALPAGTNLLGQIVAALSTSALYNGTTSLTPKFAVISAASSGDNTLVSGVSTKKLRVLSYVMVADGTVTAQFQSSTAGNLSGAMAFVANTGVSAAYCPTGHFETAAGEDLQLNLGGAVGVRGHLTYVEV